MPPKKRIAQPIDRPLSKAYLRGFTGWSTAFPPGASDPASVRVMDNVWVDRNGALTVRPGLRCLSYTVGPDSPLFPGYPGVALDNLNMVGSMELFYTADGSRAMLFAVREDDGTVGFRALLMSSSVRSVYELTEPEINFIIPNGEESLRFSSNTTYVKYLQINNKILALSDAGEPARYFDVGERKVAKALTTVSVPNWVSEDKLSVVFPAADWINDHNGYYEVFNGVLNPTFDGGYYGWKISDNAEWLLINGEMRLTSKPQKLNAIPNPLQDPAASSASWNTRGPATAAAASGFLRITATGPGEISVASDKFAEGIRPFERYKIAFNLEQQTSSNAALLVDFYTIDGAQVENTLRVPVTAVAPARTETAPIQVPEGAVAMRVSFAATATAAGQTFRVRQVCVIQEDESTSTFDGNDSGSYFWTGTPYASASVWHPVQTVTLTSNRTPVKKNQNTYGSIDARNGSGAARTVTLRVKSYNTSGAVNTNSSSSTLSAGASSRLAVTETSEPYTSAELQVEIANCARGGYVYFDDALVCSTNLADPGYFDGSMVDTDLLLFQWEDLLRPPHAPHHRPSPRGVAAAARRVPAP